MWLVNRLRLRHYYLRVYPARQSIWRRSLRHRKPYKKRTDSPDTRGQIIGRISIDERPAIVDDKIHIGDWEADTVLVKTTKVFLVTLADRVSKKTLIAHVLSKHAEVITNPIIKWCRIGD